MVESLVHTTNQSCVSIKKSEFIHANWRWNKRTTRYTDASPAPPSGGEEELCGVLSAKNKMMSWANRFNASNMDAFVKNCYISYKPSGVGY